MSKIYPGSTFVKNNEIDSNLLEKLKEEVLSLTRKFPIYKEDING